MTLVFDNPPVPSPLVDPKDLKLDLLRGQDYESNGATLRTATYDGADILLDGVPLVTVANVKALDVTFDADDNALVVYTDAGDNLWVYDDSNQSTTDLTVTAQDPRIHNDRQASQSIVMSYRRGNDVFYRISEAVGDPLWSEVNFLLYPEANLADLSDDARAISNIGGSISTGSGPFGGNSIACGSGISYDTTNPSYTEFTVECWVKFNAIPNQDSLINLGGGFPAGLLFRQSSNTLVEVFFPSGSVLMGTFTPTVGSWHHYRFARDDSDSLFIYIDGVMRNVPATNNSAIPSGVARIGVSIHNAAEFLDGEIAQVRFTNAYRDNSDWPITAPFPTGP